MIKCMFLNTQQLQNVNKRCKRTFTVINVIEGPEIKGLQVTVGSDVPLWTKNFLSKKQEAIVQNYWECQ